MAAKTKAGLCPVLSVSPSRYPRLRRWSERVERVETGEERAKAEVEMEAFNSICDRGLLDHSDCENRWVSLAKSDVGLLSKSSGEKPGKPCHLGKERGERRNLENKLENV